MLDQLAGNTALKQGLQAALTAGRLSHTVLLCGEKGTGTGFAARALAADWLYPQGGPGAQAVLERRAAECIEVHGEGASGEIKIDRVRQVRRQVFDTALSAEGRVVIFYGAHKLNQSSANALLKVLEEPPEGVLFILTAVSAAAVLPTIRSRANSFALAPVSPQECVAFVAARCPGAANAALLAKAYGGRIGTALAAAGEPEAKKSFDTACTLAKAIAGRDEYALLCALTAYEKDKPAAARLLEDLSCVAAAALEGEPGFGLSPRQAARTAGACGAALEQMGRNLNQKLLLTRLASRLAG